MISEFQGTHKRVFKVDLCSTSGLKVTQEISAHELYASYANEELNHLDTKAAPRFHWRKWIERVMLPAGFPNSTTPDLVQVAKWDAVQTLCTSIISTLAIRAVLIGVGVGASGANAIGSTASWMLRDGVLMISSVVFATRVSSKVGCRAKTWRLIADISNDIALLVELCSAWFSRPIFLMLVATASVLKALVSVAGEGTRQALLQHFAKVGNSADVDAKARNRSNIASLLGLLLGTVVSYMTPPSSWRCTLEVFVLFAIGHLMANYMSVRSMILTSLNVPVLEWCLERFYEHEMKLQAIAKKTDITLEGGRFFSANEKKTSSSRLDISPELANKEESLFILPPTSLPSQISRIRPLNVLAKFLFGRLCFLSVKIYFGASLYTILNDNASLPPPDKQFIIEKVQESLTSSGVALLFDEIQQAYYVLLPEIISSDGQPKSWAAVSKQFGLFSKSKTPSESPSLVRHQNDTQDASGLPDDVEAQRYGGGAFEGISRRFLWAYFYAYSHTRARGLRQQTTAEAGAEAGAGGGEDAPAVGEDGARPTLHVIQSLRADGVFDLRRQCCRLPPASQPSVNDDMAAPDQDPDDDQLYPLYLRFVSELQRNGWEVDRFLVSQQNYTIDIHHL